MDSHWRIVETELWDQETLVDCVVPAHLTLGCHRLGEMELIAIGASVDYRIVERGGEQRVEFSWQGFDESDPTCGRGWARLVGDTLTGELFIHQGDETTFVARREL